MNNDWKCLDAEAKAATLQCVEEMPEPDDSDPLKQRVGPGKPDVGDITSATGKPSSIQFT